MNRGFIYKDCTQPEVSLSSEINMKLFLCCVLLFTCCCSLAVGQMAMDCCLQVKNKEVTRAAVVDYSVQISGHGCAIDAIVLVTRHQRTLCVPPSQTWVKKIVRHVNELKKYCKKTGYKPRRCTGVKVE